MLCLNGFEPFAETADRQLPGNGTKWPLFAHSKQRSCCPIRSVKNIKSLPAFWTCHSKIDRVVRGWCQRNGFSVLHVDIQVASGRAISTHGLHDCVSRMRVNLAGQTELRWIEQQFTSQRTSGMVQQTKQRFRDGVSLTLHDFTTPGIRKGTTARKNR